MFVNDSLGLLLFIKCCSFLSWRTCEILLRCSLVTTFWSLFWNPLLIVHVSFQLLFSISLWYFGCFFEIRWLFLKNLDLFVEVFCEILFNFLIIDLETVVCVCKWFVGTPSFHHMLLLYDVLAKMWDSFVMFSSQYLLITDFKLHANCPCLVSAFVFHQPLIFQMFDFFEESWLVCWSFCEILFNFLIIDLATVVCVCKWFVVIPSFHHMLFLYDVLANMWDSFAMFSSHYLLITNLKPLVDCPCIVPAFVFHQPLIFQMFFWNQMTFLKNLDLFVEVFCEILFNFLIIDLETVVCVCKWFVGTPSFHHMLLLYDVLANLWDSFVMFSSHYLLITDFKLLANCPCLVSDFVFHQPLIFQMFDFFEESWLVCWSFCEILFNFLIIDLATVVCVCKWFVGTPSFHHMLLLYDVLANMWDSFVMFSSHYLLITDFKLLANCPCLVSAFVFHQPLIFQMFDFFEESWLVCWSFCEILFNFLIIDLATVVCVCKWFVGTPSFHHMLLLYDVLANMWDSFVMFSSHYLLITDFKLLANCPCLVSAFVFHQPLIFQMFDFFEESWLVCWSFCEILFNFLIIDLATVVCVCKWFVGTPSFHHMLLLYDVLANMWDSFVMFSSHYLLITDFKLLANCPCLVSAFVFHQPLIFQMFDFFEESWLVCWSFCEILFNFLIIDLATVVCVCKWFVGTPSFHHMLFLYDVLANMWDSFAMFSSHYLLITNLKPLVDCPCIVPAFVFHQPLIFQMFFWNQMTFLKNLDLFVEVFCEILFNFFFDHRSWNRRLCL